MHPNFSNHVSDPKPYAKYFSNIATMLLSIIPSAVLTGMVFPLLAAAAPEPYNLYCSGVRIYEPGGGYSIQWTVTIPVADLTVSGRECQDFQSHMTNIGLDSYSYDCGKDISDSGTWQGIYANFGATKTIVPNDAINAGASSGTPCNLCCQLQ